MEKNHFFKSSADKPENLHVKLNVKFEICSFFSEKYALKKKQYNLFQRINIQVLFNFIIIKIKFPHSSAFRRATLSNDFKAA
jgi:hypothetical protein